MTTTRSSLVAFAMAAMVVLAGCAGTLSNGTATPGATDDRVVGETPADTDVDGGGTIEFYVSDEENAIEDFAHLNVTITKVGLHRTGGGNDASEDPTGTAAPTETATPTDAEEKEGEDDDDEGNAKWVEYEVNRTVDLTELKGANATKLHALVAPNGSYDKVFVYVDGIEAALKHGDSVTVKLPSNKLQINKGFTVGDGQSVSFVFDLTVKQAGKSGKYVLQPLISESGTGEEVEIEDVDEGEDDDEREDEDVEDETDDGEPETGASDEGNESAAASDLTAEFRGPVEAGEEAKLKVTDADGPVAGATVTVDGETVGTTDAAGTITLGVPGDAAELEVTVTTGDVEVEVTADRPILDDRRPTGSRWSPRCGRKPTVRTSTSCPRTTSASTSRRPSTSR